MFGRLPFFGTAQMMPMDLENDELTKKFFRALELEVALGSALLPGKRLVLAGIRAKGLPPLFGPIIVPALCDFIFGREVKR